MTMRMQNYSYDKVILLICDGLGDRPYTYMEAGDQTPLQAAHTPNMDEMSRKGINGLMDVIAPGIVPGSDTSHLSILGYDPYTDYPGRGVFEALGADMELKEGDVAFRANFATVDEKMRVIDRRAGRKGSKNLANALNGIEIEKEKVKIFLKNTSEHRCAVVMRGKNLSKLVSDVDTHEEGGFIKKCVPLPVPSPLPLPLKGEEVEKEREEEEENASITADIVNKFVKSSYETLKEHPENEERRKKGFLPANILLLRGAGRYDKVEKMEKKFGFSAACIAGGALYKGIAKYLGMKLFHVSGATGRADTDLRGKAEAALRAIDKKDFVFIHVKATDNFGHDGNFEGKRRMIEKIDKELVALLKDANVNAYFVITGDHSTPISIRRHSSDSVPIVIKGEGVRKDKVKSFDEFSAASGGLGRIRGRDLMPILTDFMGYYKMHGT